MFKVLALALEVAVVTGAGVVDSDVARLEAENAALKAQLRSTRRRLQFGYSEGEPMYEEPMETCEEEIEASEHETMVVQNALYLYNSTTLEADKSLIYHTAQVGGLAWLDTYQELYDDQEFTMATVSTLTMVDFMQGDIFQLPTTSNEPSDVTFELPDVSTVEFDGPASLVYMPILDMAALIQARLVSCVDVVQTFVDRIKEFEPYLAITSLLLEDRALETAAAYDAVLADNGTVISPLMCIPFGMKDHHSIYGDEYTRDGCACRCIVGRSPSSDSQEHSVRIPNETDDVVARGRIRGRRRHPHRQVSDGKLG